MRFRTIMVPSSLRQGALEARLRDDDKLIAAVGIEGGMAYYVATDRVRGARIDPRFGPAKMAPLITGLLMREFAPPREPDDDDEAMAGTPHPAAVGEARGDARGVGSASPASPPGRVGASQRDERIAEIEAMCERSGGDPAVVARHYSAGTVSSLTELTDAQLERALSDAYEARDAGEGE